MRMLVSSGICILHRSASDSDPSIAFKGWFVFRKLDGSTGHRSIQLPLKMLVKEVFAAGDRSGDGTQTWDEESL